MYYDAFRLVIFALKNLSALGHWQATAEMTGRETARIRAEAHRRLQNQTADALRATLRRDLAALEMCDDDEFDLNAEA